MTIFMKIENLTKRLVLLRLNSGRTLSLDPGTVSERIRDVELAENVMAEKLRDRQVIALHPSKGPGKGRTPGTEKPGKVTTKKDKEQSKAGSKGGK